MTSFYVKKMNKKKTFYAKSLHLEIKVKNIKNFISLK